MKTMLLLMFCCWMFSAGAQVPVLKITTDKTASLIFPYTVKHVDRGTADVLVQQVREAGHILLVKAATADFRETNMSVVTGDGHLYTFRVCYEKEPREWVYELSAPARISVAAQAACILDNPAAMRSVRQRRWDITARVKGLYSKDDVLYLHLEMTNSGPLDYEIDYLRFYLRDRGRVKRTAIQEVEQSPLHIAGQTGRVKGGSTAVMVVALEKFTIPDAQYFLIDIGEKRGGRHLQLKMGNRSITGATAL